MFETNEIVSNQEILRRLENAPRRTPPALDAGRSSALAWLALAPAWPESLAVQGFPHQEGVLATGSVVVEFLRGLASEGLAMSGPGEPPLAGTWYWMEDGQRRSVISAVLGNFRQGVAFLEVCLRECAAAMRQALGNAVPPPALARWLTLATARDTATLAEVITERVNAAIAGSEQAGGLYSAEAAAWAEAARPLAEIFGGAAEVALAGVNRRLEVYRRDARDLRYLKNYFARSAQEAAFDDLIAGPDDGAWALHYVGMGGIGKTMLMRRIRTTLARERKLAVGHVDFDQLNPDYPRRAPGLLLQSLVGDLRFNDDPVVAKLFAGFDQAIQNAHRQLRGPHKASSAASGQQPEALRHAIGFFIEALNQIGRQGLRPLLILDTCEELARMRLDHTIPENLRFTFELVEQIHQGAPALRVVFSGRRALASAGWGWTWPGCTLPPREYLRLFEIVPFYADEAGKFLREYTRDNRKVPPSIVQAILTQSRVRTTQSATWSSRVQWANPAAHAAHAGDFYYPFDLDLFARWACSPEGLDEQKLLESGAHYYVKERIVDRIGPILRPWLADLALLGRFDQRLIQDLTGYSDRSIGSLWRAIVEQEWTELDRNAQADEVWSMDGHLRERLLDYYREEDSLSLESSRPRVAALLKRVTLNRAFKDLSPAHFEACLQVLATRPQEAAAWWNEVEARIARESRWEWANELVATLLGDTLADEGPMYAAILALQAAAQLHLWPERVQTSWPDVLARCKNHPDPVARERLQFRASAGVVIAWARSGAATAEATGRSTLALLNTLRGAPADEQSAGTVTALIENLIERLESTERRSLMPLFAEVRELPAAQVWNVPGLSETLNTFASSLHARLRLDGSSIAPAVPREALAKPEQRWLDWRAPDNLLDRLRLESIRSGAKVVELPQGPVDNIDSDRLLSAGLLEELDRGLNSPAPPKFDDPEVAPAFVPLCNAHRAYPPSIAPRIEWIAAHGAPDAALRLATRILGDAQLPADHRKAVETHLLKVVLRFRLYEEKIGVDSGSMNQRDLGILAACVASPGVTETASKRSEAIAELRQELEELVPERAERRKGENLLLTAILESSYDALKARESFEAARAAFDSTHDQVGSQLCRIGKAGCDAMLGELAARSQLDLISEDWKPQGESLGEWTAWLDASPRALRPWRARVVACFARLSEPADAARFMSWADGAYRGQLPEDLRRIVAPAPKIDPFTGFGRQVEGAVVAAAKPGLRRAALGLLGLITIGAAGYGLYQGWVYLLRLSGVDWPTSWRVGSFIAFLALIGSLPRMWSGYMSLLSDLVVLRMRVGDRNASPVDTDPLRSPVAVNQKLCLTGTHFEISREREGTAGPALFEQSYAAQSAATPIRSVAHFQIENIIQIEGAAAAPWEAIFALKTAQSGLYHDQKSRFRREVSTSPPSLSNALPIAAWGRVVTWRLDTDRISAQVWDAALAGRIVHGIEEPVPRGDALRRDDSIEVLHILGKPVEINGTLGLQMLRSDSSIETALYPRWILSEAPRARLCIVQDFPGELSVRTTTDRYAANVARLFGWQMHSLGVAAVIMIPPLPDELSRAVLMEIAKAVGRFSRMGRRFLLDAVETSRRTISKEGRPDPQSASETACDLVLYSAQQVRFDIGASDSALSRGFAVSS